MSSPPNASCEGRKVATTGPLGHWALSALQWRPRRQQAAQLLRPFLDRWPYSDHYFIILFNYSCLQLILGSLLWICYYYYKFFSIIFRIWFWIFFTYGIHSHKFLAPPLYSYLEATTCSDPTVDRSTNLEKGNVCRSHSLRVLSFDSSGFISWAFNSELSHTSIVHGVQPEAIVCHPFGRAAAPLKLRFSSEAAFSLVKMKSFWKTFSKMF